MRIGVIILMIDLMRVFGLQIAHMKWLNIDQRLMCSMTMIGGGSLAGVCAVCRHGSNIMAVLWTFGFGCSKVEI